MNQALSPETVDERQREGDLGHEQQRRAAGLERPGNRLGIDRGLARSGRRCE